jgi:molecular chaperone GrpE (heat shock protein)
VLGWVLAALQRERADFLNFRRRATQEWDNIGQAARSGIFRLLLSLLDDSV